jgi:hypothetical protein
MYAPDPLHWTHNSYFEAFRTISLLHKSRCKAGQTGAINARSLNEVTSENFATNALLHSVGPKTHVMAHSGPFRYRTDVDAKLAELAPLTQKFAKRSYVGKFRNERT